jgi:hypothetical protein
MFNLLFNNMSGLETIKPSRGGLDAATGLVASLGHISF